MAEHETIGGIDADTKSALEDQVKKGKARKFILICKGASIENLTVFKKGPYATRIAQAKKAGFRGTAYCGVVTGKGVNIDLQLPGNAAVSQAMGTDGNAYDEEPCKVAKLREFLAEAGDLKFKPTISIVTSVTQVVAVSESDDEEADEHPASSAPAAAAADDLADKLKQRLTDAMKKLVPAMQQAIKAQPARRDELLSRANQFNSHLKGDELDVAQQILQELQRILQETQDGAGAAPAPGAAEPASAVATFTVRLKALKPEIDKAIASGTPSGQAIKLRASEAATFGRQKDFEQAAQRLDAIEAILAGKSAPPESPAGAQAEPSSGAFVDYMKSRLAWDSARKSAQAELEKLQRAMIEDTEEPEADAAETIQAVDKLAGLLNVFDEQLSDALDDALNAGPDERRKHHQRALLTVERYLAFIDSHPILLVIDDNPFVRVRVSETLSSTLADIASKLSA